jgi:hypothetical protein
MLAPIAGCVLAADRRKESDADGGRLLQDRMPRRERRHEDHAEKRRDAEVVPETSLPTSPADCERDSNAKAPVGRSGPANLAV